VEHEDDEMDEGEETFIATPFTLQTAHGEGNHSFMVAVCVLWLEATRHPEWACLFVGEAGCAHRRRGLLSVMLSPTAANGLDENGTTKLLMRDHDAYIGDASQWLTGARYSPEQLPVADDGGYGSCTAEAELVADLWAARRES
jgi:hypothetical protein